MRSLNILFVQFQAGLSFSVKAGHSTESRLLFIRPDTVIAPSASRHSLPSDSTMDVRPQTLSSALKVSDMAPPIDAVALSGKVFSPDFMKGRTSVLFFWKPDAATSSDIFGGLNTLSGIYARVTFIVFLTMPKGKVEEVKEFLENNLMPAHNTVEHDDIIESFAISKFPTLAVVDKNGRLFFTRKFLIILLRVMSIN